MEMSSTREKGSSLPSKTPSPPGSEREEGEKEKKEERYREVKSELADVILIVEKELHDNDLALSLWEAMKIVHKRLRELER